MNEGTCRWISVEERLPESGIKYDVVVSGTVQRVHLSVNGWSDELPVTHWLEVLPPPPPKKKVVREGWVDPGMIHNHRESCDSKPACIKVTYEE